MSVDQQYLIDLIRKTIVPRDFRPETLEEIDYMLDNMDVKRLTNKEVDTLLVRFGIDTDKSFKKLKKAMEKSKNGNKSTK